MDSGSLWQKRGEERRIFWDFDHLKRQSYGYFLYFCHKFAKFISKDLAHADIAFRLLRKQNQMNFERKTSQNQFLLILSETH